MTTATLTATLTPQEAYDALERVVERHGADTKYVDRDPEWSKVGRCMNVDAATGEALCIVGTLLVEEFGFTAQDFIDAGVICSSLLGVVDAIPRARVLVGGTFTDTYQVLRLAQQAQDKGVTWGEALAAAKPRVA